MSQAIFSIKTTIQESWTLVRKNWKFFVPLTLLAWIIQFIPSYFADQVTNNILIVITALVSWLINSAVAVGLIAIAVKFLQSGSSTYTYPLEKKSYFLSYLLGSIYYSLIVLVGLILLIVPGIIWAIRYQFYAYFIIDQGLSPKAALAKSKEVTQGKVWHLFLFSLALMGVNLLGLLALGVGLLVSVPVSFMAIAKVYRILAGSAPIAQSTTSSKPPASAPPATNLWKQFRQN